MRPQAGAVGVCQLAGLGFTKDEVATLVARGELWRRYHGVYIDARAPATARTQLFAALLAVGPDAFFSHRTAAALHGLRPLNVHELELTVIADHTPRHQGLRIHRTTTAPEPSELRIRDGLRCSSPARVLRELAPRETKAELDRLIAEMARRKLLDVRRTLALAAGHAGAAKLRAALAAYRPKPFDKSRLERAFAAWLATELPDLPAPQRNVYLDNRWEIDFWWPEHRLAVELDGEPYHSLPDDLERDRVKDVWLQRHDIHIVRVTDHRFDHDRRSVESDLRHFLSRGAEGRAA